MAIAAEVGIVPATLALFDLEEEGVEGPASALGVRPPPVWPAEVSDATYRKWQRGLLAAQPAEPRYAGHYLVAGGELVGTCGFKGPPADDGMVEIGYSVIAPRRRRGYATRAVELLVEKAFADPRVKVIVGETLPDGAASQRVLLRCGFKLVGTRLDDDDGNVLRFELERQIGHGPIR